MPRPSIMRDIATMRAHIAGHNVICHIIYKMYDDTDDTAKFHPTEKFPRPPPILFMMNESIWRVLTSAFPPIEFSRPPLCSNPTTTSSTTPTPRPCSVQHLKHFLLPRAPSSNYWIDLVSGESVFIWTNWFRPNLYFD